MSDPRAVAIQERLIALRKAHGGRLTPSVVVKDAGKPNSPLHDYFEWNDGRAGAQYRLMQARHLIRSVEVVIRTDTAVFEAIAYVRDPRAAATEQGYVAIESLRNDPESAREALLYECRRVAGLLERTRKIALTLGLASEVDAMLEGLDALQGRIAA